MVEKGWTPRFRDLLDRLWRRRDVSRDGAGEAPAPETAPAAPDGERASPLALSPDEARQAFAPAPAYDVDALMREIGAAVAPERVLEPSQAAPFPPEPPGAAEAGEDAEDVEALMKAIGEAIEAARPVADMRDWTGNPRAHIADKPPSSFTSAPVMNRLSSEAR